VGKYILLTFLLVMSYLPAYGSSIIVARNDNEIIIGTDSKRVRTATEDLSDARSELICKIVRADNIFITSAGIVGIDSYNQRRGIPREFDLTEVMKKAALSEGSIMDKADTLAKSLSGDLLRISEWVKKKMPALFKQMSFGKQLLHVVMAGLENGTPTFIVMAFELSISPSGEQKINVEFHPCPGIACPSNFVYIFMGKHEAIDRYLPQDPDIWKNNPVDVVRKLIEIEMTSEHETIGPPIDILRITKEGSEWIQKKDMCADFN
jgi:hypothetical protein